MGKFLTSSSNRTFNQIIPEAILRATASIDFSLNSQDGLEAIRKLLARTVLYGGKRLRPLLTCVMADYVDLDANDALFCAKAIEMVHAASLAHDDVIDEASTRRGLPSINIVSSNKRSILAGDFLLAEVIVGLCQLNRPDIVSLMAKVIKDLSEGEWIQLDAAQSRNYTSNLIEEIALKKTASVMSFCTEAPLMLLNASQDCLDFGKKIGVHLGLAFQLIDDTLDFSSTSQKDEHLDIDNNMLNAVTFCYLENNPDLMASYQNGKSLSLLLKDVKKDQIQSSIDQVRQKALEHLEISRQSLRNLSEILSHSKGKNFQELKEKEKMILSLLDLVASRQS